MKFETSDTNPLRIGFAETRCSGYVGLTICPGKKQKSGWYDFWHERDLDTDLERIKNYQTPNGQPITMIVSLIEDGRFEENEFKNLKVENLGEKVEEYGFKWIWIPCRDTESPRDESQRIWEENKQEIIDTLQKKGENVLVHCKGGLGRAGTISAMILNETGIPIKNSIDMVREARSNTINGRQELWLLKNFSKGNFS